MNLLGNETKLGHTKEAESHEFWSSENRERRTAVKTLKRKSRCSKSHLRKYTWIRYADMTAKTVLMFQKCFLITIFNVHASACYNFASFLRNFSFSTLQRIRVHKSQ